MTHLPHLNVGMHHGASAPDTSAPSVGASAPDTSAPSVGASAPDTSAPVTDTSVHGVGAPDHSVDTHSDAPWCIPTGHPLVGQHTTTFPQRKNIRAEFHDYSGGDYFVTICTRDKAHYFGEIKDREMQLSAVGKYAYQALATLATHYRYVEVLPFVVMPNHIHAIISIHECADAPWCIPTVRTALGVVVGGYKQAVTRYARRNGIDFGWQSRYHDHIIRGFLDGNMIADYINNNVARWANDCHHT